MLSVNRAESNYFDGRFNLINEFSQKASPWNCVPIALIKASMDKYGKDMFRETRSDGNGGYNVTLRNGKQVSISREELQQAKQEMDVNTRAMGSSEAMNQAALAYAAIAKGKAADERTSYGSALKNLKATDGENVQNVSKWLGVQVARVNPSQVGNADAAVVLGNPRGAPHAMYVDDGKRVDLWGTENAFNPKNYSDAYLLV